ncbi:MAG TPA: sulfotransferase [Gammaproteobacteria bacterium]
MQHRHVFILTPPFSGSTLLVRLLATSPQVSTFSTERGEGMNIPELREVMQPDRWDPAKPMPWDQIRRVFESHWDMTRPVLVEKGPANQLRTREIEAAFTGASFVIMMRDPYAWCESMDRRGRRRGAAGLAMGEHARRWLLHARILREEAGRLARVLRFSYEALCDDTAEVVGKLVEFVPEIGALDPARDFDVHSTFGKRHNPITNANLSALARLDAVQRREISSVLGEDPALLEYFSYELRAS